MADELDSSNGVEVAKSSDGLNNTSTQCRYRLAGSKKLFRSLQIKLPSEGRARQLASILEDQVARMHKDNENAYLAAINALSAELAKAPVKEADIVKLTQTDAPNFELFMATLCNPKYFEL